MGTWPFDWMILNDGLVQCMEVFLCSIQRLGWDWKIYHINQININTQYKIAGKTRLIPCTANYPSCSDI